MQPGGFLACDQSVDIGIKMLGIAQVTELIAANNRDWARTGTGDEVGKMEQGWGEIGSWDGRDEKRGGAFPVRGWGKRNPDQAVENLGTAQDNGDRCTAFRTDCLVPILGVLQQR